MIFKWVVNLNILLYTFLLICKTSVGQDCSSDGIKCISCTEYQNCNGEFPEGSVVSCKAGGSCLEDHLKQCQMKLNCYALNECTQSGIFPDVMVDSNYYVCLNDASSGFLKYEFTCPTENFFDKSSLTCVPREVTLATTDVSANPTSSSIDPASTASTASGSPSTSSDTTGSTSSDPTSSTSSSTSTDPASSTSSSTSTDPASSTSSDPTSSTSSSTSTDPASSTSSSTSTDPASSTSSDPTSSTSSSTSIDPASSTSSSTSTDPASSTSSDPTSSTSSSTSTDPASSTSPTSTGPPSSTSTTSSSPSTPTTPIPTTMPFSCLASGIFPNPDNCKMYYRCSTSLKAFFYICPGNSYFNEITLKCSMNISPSCQEQILKNSTSTVPTTTPTATTTTTITTPITTTTTTPKPTTSTSTPTTTTPGISTSTTTVAPTTTTTTPATTTTTTTTTPASSTPFSCPMTGIYANPSDCKIYYRCALSGKIFQYVCPGNTYFNEFTKRCSLVITPRCKSLIQG